MKDSGRFLIRRWLGEGGMGVVYEAFDRERGERVALKTLSYLDGAAVYRLKQEFRALADIAHPNLVSLYELVADDDKWFFTMELIEGVNFIEHVRSGPEGRGDSPRSEAADREDALHEERLRGALRQLAEGMMALHAGGRAHRDVKPSNVLVDGKGRVVILDFGLSSDLTTESAHTETDRWAPGTAHYMAPEQIEDDATEASDWYSVGVMLYEALTGSLPFEGSHVNVMYRKQKEDAPRILEVDPDAPRDLARLCDELLSRDSSRRPDAVEVLERLGASPDRAAFDSTPSRRRVFIGREEHLADLEDALRATREGRPATVYLHGLSGMGKSTIVEEFVSRVRRDRRAVVLTGRCYDRESVPYNALDGVIDSLSHYLRTLPASELDGLVPPDAHMVARLFPVLLRVEEFAKKSGATFDDPDPREVRRRAVEALREMLGRIAQRAPLLIHVDDWHWSDADSIALGTDLLRDTDPPNLLLIVSFRSEEIPAKPFLKSFLDDATTATRREMVVGPLEPSEGVRLAEALLPPDEPRVRRLRDAIVREAGGSPFFIEQLCRHVVDGGVRGAEGTRLGVMLEARMSRLPSGSRQLLETLAVAGRPLDFGIAYRAAELEPSVVDVRALVSTLRVAHMIRPSVQTDQIEVYHDRIRETVLEGMTPVQVSRVHGRLAEILADSEASQPEVLFEHYRGAGESTRAGEQAARAAKKAAGALAFDRAIRLYRHALEIGSRDPDDIVEWQAGLGDALAADGRPGDAARAYLVAAEETGSEPRSLQLRRSAAEHFLIGGHNEKGLEVTHRLLEEVGLRMPRSPRMVLLSLLFRRAQIALRGLGYELSSEEEADPIDLLRMDICLACALGLTMTDYIVAAYFQARYLLLALDVGEPRRLARALAFEGGFVASRGGPARRRTEKVIAKARELAEELGTPREVGMAEVTATSAAVMQGEFARADALATRAEKILREQCTGVHWELTTCQIFHITALTYTGRTAEVVRLIPELMESAHRRGNLFESVELRTRPNIFWLLQDDPAEARRQLSEAMAHWSRRGFYRQDYNWLRAEAQIDLYRDEPTVAWARLEEHRSALRRSQLLRVQLLRLEQIQLQGRVDLAMAAHGHSTRTRLLRVERAARRIEREKMAWSTPFAPLLRAGAAAVKGEMELAVQLLSRSVAGFEAGDMALYARAARRRLGEVLGGDKGRELVDEADAVMRSEAIASPERLSAMLAPGFDG